MNTRSAAKKILIITNDFYPSRGGIQECMMGLASSFGSRAVVLAPYYAGYNLVTDQEVSFSIKRTNGLRQDRVIDKLLFLFLRRPFAFLLRTICQVYRLRKSGINSFIICGHLTTILVGIMARRLFGVPLCCVMHGKELLFGGLLRPFKRIFGKFLINRSDILFMSNSFVEEKLVAMGMPARKMVKIPFGVNFPGPRSNPEAKKKGEKKSILTVGRLVERKGHAIVLNALPEIAKKHPDVNYLIVGKGPMEKNLKRAVEKKDLWDFVQFYGEVDNIADFYAACDVFIMPSRFIEKKGDVEGFGLVFLEANYFGKPVVAGKSGGIADAVIDGVTGILVNPDDPKEIADAVIKLFDNPKLARKLGGQGRRRVLDEFTWERAASIIERVMMQHQVKSEKYKVKSDD